MATPQLDRLTAGGTSDVFGRIRLGDGNYINLRTLPGGDVIPQVYLWPGVTAPDSWGAHLNDWFTGADMGTHYAYVPVEAVRDLIVQYGGEHADQDGTGMPPRALGETAGAFATRALAARGLKATTDRDAGNSWLVIDRDQADDAYPNAAGHVALYVYDPEGDGEVMVDRAPDSARQIWAAVATDERGDQRLLIDSPFEQVEDCVAAIAQWVAARTHAEAVKAPLVQLRAAGIECITSWDSGIDYVSIRIDDDRSLRFTGTTRGKANGIRDDGSIRHPISDHESWRVEVERPAGSFDLYDSHNCRLSYEEDTTALVAVITALHQR
ncbi:hypothetical protein [Streptomyces sp. NPDC006640]|uniref:hypothetical protein n=1 Tax=unclassified Streptomyces TaxID=2593676 RepID=UPI0036BC92AC